MPDLLIRDTNRDELVQEIASAVCDQLRSLLSETHEPRLVDAERMAELAGIARPTLDRMIACDAVPSITVGRRRLFRPSDVIDQLAQNQHTPTRLPSIPKEDLT